MAGRKLVLVLVGVVFIVMHLFGHKGHGHGGYREQDNYGDEDQQRKNKAPIPGIDIINTYKIIVKEGALLC